MRAFEQRKKSGPDTSTFFGPKIQKKIKTGTVGDKYEVEADAVADKVVNNKPSAAGLLQSKEEVQQKPISETISSVQSKEKKEEEKVQKKSDKKEEEKTVQAKCADCEKEGVQKKEDKKEEEKPVQKKGKNTESEIHDSNLEGRLNSSKGSGATLDKNTKNEMEAGFGTDFSNVKIHTDSSAVQMSQELGAQAFTSGNDVYFNEGKYNPGSTEGKHLLAHELTHTVQQGNRSKNVQKQSDVVQLASIPWNISQWTTHKRESSNFSVSAGGSIALSSNLDWVGPPRCRDIASTIEVKIYKSVDLWFDSKVHEDTISLSGGSTSVSGLEGGTYYVEIYLGGYNGDPTHCSLTGSVGITTT
ncbi:DUF4157 domain-containing protein [Flavobacterium sp.]|uniref:eCIS core domain-containing protein n=1 Tax=Flavobacterium sp. TaxID=239 RepID=UPI0025BE6DD9|nr:DUF4157 domain-containing protein [Flavobacterium sp.]